MVSKIKSDGETGGFATNGGVPLGARLASEIVKPRDWGALQRNCVVLFREELRDPNTKEYGRNGQKQGGIDILGYRNGDPAHAVGIQCRNIGKSLKQSVIMKDCRSALALEFGLREVIFATTAPDDTKSDQAAKAVERELRAEGRDLTVHVYGWGQLQTLIAMHEPAYNAFMPGVVASARPVEPDPSSGTEAEGLMAIIADTIAQQMRGYKLAPQPDAQPAGPNGIGEESPALHAKIDVLRDLVREGGGKSLEQRLIALRDSPEAADALWARYRIETNIAASQMDQGRELDAAETYERAHAMRPDDPGALANLSIAKTIKGDPDEGMRIAREVLARPDRTTFALSALLQAASRSDWRGDPDSLVPEDMRGTPTAELAVADFLRKRWLPGWEARTLALPDGESDFDDIGRQKALAILSIAVDSRVHVVGGKDAVTDAQIDAAATEMQSHAVHFLRNGYQHHHDLMAHVSNGALLLRLAGRNEEAEDLLREGLRAAPGEDQLMRLLAMSLIDRGHLDEALAVLEPGTEPETVLMKAQFSRTGTAADRLAILQRMSEPADDRVAGMRRRLTVELALMAKDLEAADQAIEDMLRHPGDVVAAKLLQVQRDRQTGILDEEANDRLLRIASELGDDANPIDRFLVAEALLEAGMPGNAADLVVDHIDLSSPRPATFLFLTALADARRDGEYRDALAAASDAVRGHPDVLWLDARHAWNAGDVERTLVDAERLLQLKPDLPKAVLLRIEALLRLDRSRQVLEAIDEPIEDLPWKGSSDPFRVANLLSHFGHHDRAARYAYKLFLVHRDKPRAWMTLSSMTIREGQEPGVRPDAWSPEVVAPEVAVDFEYDDGGTAFFIVEPDSRLRSMDSDSWEPEHPLVRAVMGLAIGDAFTAPDGRRGTITKLRHKIVARFHYVLENYEKRFPEVFGFKSMTIDPTSPNGLDDLIASLKERHDWVLSEQESHFASGMPIDVLAARLGLDTIDVAAGIVEQGLRLSVAAGNEEERLYSRDSIIANSAQGCVLDLLAFWSAWRLKVLDQLARLCGPISVPQSVVDRLQARRERLAMSITSGHGSIAYQDGKILHTEIPPERVAELRDDVSAALAWIKVNDAARPVVLDETLPPVVRDHVRSGRSDMLDAIAISLRSGHLLLCDDLALRAMHKGLGGTRSAWLHLTLTHAADIGALPSEEFTQLTVDMIASGQSYVGVSGSMIALGMEMDALQHGRLGGRATALVSRLGGKEAEVRSHVQAACEAIAHLWSTQSVRAVREPATGLILERLIRERDEWRDILAVVIKYTARFPDAQQYVRDWARGHFLPGFA